MNLGFLSAKIGGLPAWAWVLAVGGGGLALWWFIGRNRGGPGALGQNASGQQSNVDTSQIDPNTGVPYSIEEAINPATGLPAYYGGPGVDGQTTTPPPTPAPGPGPGPGPTPGPTPTPNPVAQPPGPTPRFIGPPVKGPPGPTPKPKPKPKPKPRRRPRGRRGDGPDESGSGDGPDSEGTGSGPDGGACPFGLNCGSGCAGHCQSQSTPFWPVMTDVGGGRY